MILLKLFLRSGKRPKIEIPTLEYGIDDSSVYADEREENPTLDLHFYFKENVEMRVKVTELEEKQYMFVIFQNISEKVKVTENNSKLTYSMLLLSSLGHEMFTPLHQLIAIADRLLKKLESQEAKERFPINHNTSQPQAFIPSLRDDVTAVKEIGLGFNIFVDNILDFAAILNNSFNIKIQEFLASTLVDHFREMFKVKAQKKDLVYTCQCQPNLLISNDMERIKRILYIFLENAFKFTTKGAIDLKVYQSAPNMVSFRIIDTGIGIENKDMDILTRMLKKPLLSEQTKDSAGLGLGFRMAQGFLKKLNLGDLNLEVCSERRYGTTIQFDIFKQFSQGQMERNNTYSVIASKKSGIIFQKAGVNGLEEESPIARNFLKDREKWIENGQSPLIPPRMDLPHRSPMPRQVSLTASKQNLFHDQDIQKYINKLATKEFTKSPSILRFCSNKLPHIDVNLAKISETNYRRKRRLKN